MTNGYAEEFSDATVVRAARVRPQTTKPATPQAQDKVGTVIVTYTCPEGCELVWRNLSTGATYAECYNGTEHCGSPTVNTVDVGPINFGGVQTRAAQLPVVKNNLNNITPLPQEAVNARVAKKTVQKPVSTKPQVQDMAADGGAIAINCPAGCTPDCAILGNTVLCECKASDGSTCKAEVVVADDATVVK